MAERAHEFDLIARINARAGTRDDVILGIGDDAALLQVPAGMQLVVAMDTLNVGVHFPAATAAADIGWKALAVNLSDLAAMGAQPAWCTLSLSLPESDPAWLDAFLDGFLDLAKRHGVALVGGDTTRGPLSVCVTVHGFVAPGCALRRDAARVGDDIWVTGTLGDAAASLQQVLGDGDIDPSLRTRLDRPEPRIETGRALVGMAHACVDVSDGLLADLQHVCTRSEVAATLWLDALPASAALRALASSNEQRWRWQATGGDDYELCFTAPVEHRKAIVRLSEDGVTCTRIGRAEAGSGISVLAPDGSLWSPQFSGYRHFQP